MTLMAPISETWRGIRAYVRGVRWLRSHPQYFVVLLLPFVVAAVGLYWGWQLFVDYQEALFAWMLPAKPESGWWQLALYYTGQFFLYLAFTVLSLVGSMLIASVVASPIYEWVSVAVERDFTGGHAIELDIWESLKLVVEELKKALFIMTVSLVLLFVPVVNVFGTLITAFLVGWNFYDYPLARRGWSFRRRLWFVTRDFWAVMGLGLWLIIPLLQLFFIPLAIVGGTILNLESMQRQHLIDRGQAPGNLKGGIDG